MNNKIRNMVYAALLTALAIIIPIQFGFLKIIMGPFTATLASHVPTFLAMLISPYIAVIVGIGSALGFMMSGLPLVVAARAAMHAIVGYVGGTVVKKKGSFVQALIITAPIHAILEGIIVIFFGFNLQAIIVTVALGTFLHHCVDAVISYGLATAVAKATRKKLNTLFS